MSSFQGCGGNETFSWIDTRALLIFHILNWWFFISLRRLITFGDYFVSKFRCYSALMLKQCCSLNSQKGQSNSDAKVHQKETLLLHVPQCIETLLWAVWNKNKCSSFSTVPHILISLQAVLTRVPPRTVFNKARLTHPTPNTSWVWGDKSAK